MKVYLGASGPPDKDSAKEHAPEFVYGFCWTPEKMTKTDHPYILDNGAYRAFINNEVWDVDGFVRRVNQIEEMPREPDFIVLPDVVANPKLTFKRSTEWAQLIDGPKALAIQDGMTESKVGKFISNHELEALFIGGSVEWKRRNADVFVELAHEKDLIAHLARPNDLYWAKNIGVDSVDTSSIARDRDWERLKSVQNQTTLV